MFQNTDYGFKWNAAEFTRLFRDHKDINGWVSIGLQTPKYQGGNDIQI